MGGILKIFGIIVLIPLLFFLGSCQDNAFDLSPDLQLKFSVDTVLFDTVFATVGSSTQWLVVHNTHNRDIALQHIRIAGANSAVFRFNADGRTGPEVRNIEIAANDSIFLFVEVTIDPTQANLPFIVSDSLEFSLNGNKQYVNLVAWGQNARFLRPEFTDPVLNIQYHLISENTVWNDSLPFVVYGLAVVARGKRLTIQEGTQIHLHNNSSLIFLEGSSLIVEGTAQRPVVFQGDRKERFFENVPGQWGRIWLSAASKDHDINYAIIKNGTVGLHVDSIGSTERPTLRIRNTIIKNKSLVGLLAQGSNVRAENLVVSNCGKHLMMLALGGSYEFKHSTFANYFNLPGSPARTTPSVVFNNFFRDALGNTHYRPFQRLYFANSIIFGNLTDELQFDLRPASTIPLIFDHCLLRTQSNALLQGSVNLILNQMPQFQNIANQDFRLRNNSPAIGRGNPIIGLLVPYDILGRERTLPPDIGAFQYYLIEEKP